MPDSTGTRRGVAVAPAAPSEGRTSSPVAHATAVAFCSDAPTDEQLGCGVRSVCSSPAAPALAAAASLGGAVADGASAAALGGGESTATSCSLAYGPSSQPVSFLRSQHGHHARLRRARHQRSSAAVAAPPMRAARSTAGRMVLGHGVPNWIARWLQGLLLLAMLTMDGDDMSGCARGGCDGGGRAIRGAGGGGSGGEDEAARCKLEGCGIGGADGCGDGGSGTGDCGGGRGGATCRNSISARSSSRCGLVKHAASLTIARRSCA